MKPDENFQEVGLHVGVLECPGEVQGEEATGYIKDQLKLQKIKDREGGLIKLPSSTQTSFQIYSWSFQDGG